MKQILLTLLVLLAGTIGTVTPSKAAECSPIPLVDWWTHATHDRVISLVESKYRGDWKAYIVKWETQRKFLQGVFERGTRVVFKKLNVTLSGETLADYITKVDQRIAVVRCLAQRAGTAGQVDGGLAPGDSGSGQTKASDLGCGKCHGVAGTNDHPMIPNLAGQAASYLQIQLLRFRASATESGKETGLTSSRHDRIMSPPARHLTDVEIRDLSAYFADRTCGSDGDPRGDPPEAFTHCKECHGAGGMSEDPDLPHLAGQKEGYLARQLKLFRSTGRDVAQVAEEETRYHYAMAQHWPILSDETIDGLAAYLAALPCR